MRPRGLRYDDGIRGGRVRQRSDWLFARTTVTSGEQRSQQRQGASVGTPVLRWP